MTGKKQQQKIVTNRHWLSTSYQFVMRGGLFKGPTEQSFKLPLANFHQPSIL
ncbi:hypothetical protein [Thermodesulfatator indicus]|uniref:hypothetical protein n=1 Tax=Thermodesulfatator indicus TaxID=171695 RepID=UPI00145CA783|nr:hypothetical protein [Thermodesulfatator indicus]